MGFIFSKSMNDRLKAQQEFMVMNSRLQLERQLLMQNQMRERQTAMQIAWTREFLKYFGTFFGLAAVGLTTGYEFYFQIENVLGLFFYHAGSSFCIITGSYFYPVTAQRLIRCQSEAENILDTQSTLLELPKGPITYEDLEKMRRSQSKFFIEK
ncbi:PLRKT protein, partial [Nyctiprogne leucopyga]|nr:PLRKT protein [Nyctiprogne leucopyga]